MSRIIFVNRFFHPDHSATSQILSDLAFALAEEGHEVHVVTSRLRYDAGGALLPARETIRGVEVHRVRTSSFGRGAILGRLADYASFYVAAAARLHALARAGDVVVAKTDPPLISIVAHRVARRRSAFFVNWVQDLYPEIAQRLGVKALEGPLGRILVGLRRATFHDAVANVAIGERMAERLKAAGAPPRSVHIIQNWVNEQELRPVGHEDNPLRRGWGLEGRFVVAYSGNLGRAHEYETLLGAADLLRARQRLLFLFIGGGHQIKRLAADVSARGLDHLFMFRPYQPAERLSQSLSVGDVHWISLRPDTEGLIVPSKIYGVLAVGRPVIAIADPNGDIATLIDRAGCGIPVSVGDAAGFAQAIEHLMDHPDRRKQLGEAARAFSQGSVSRSSSIAAWSALLRAPGAGG